LTSKQKLYWKVKAKKKLKKANTAILTIFVSLAPFVGLIFGYYMLKARSEARSEKRRSVGELVLKQISIYLLSMILIPLRYSQTLYFSIKYLLENE